MRIRRLLWQLFFSYLFITIFSLAAALFFASWAVQGFYQEKIEESLETRARLLEKNVTRRLVNGEPGLDPLMVELGKSAKTRLTVILPDGKVVADSEKDPEQMDNHSDRPEIKKAYSGEVGRNSRYSHTLKTDMVYVAVPLMDNSKVVGVLRASTPVESVGAALHDVRSMLILGGLIAALAAAVTSLYVSRKITKPLEEMKKVAERFSAGELDLRMPVPDSVEVAGLAEAMNEMATQLDERIRVINEQKGRQEAILSSMQEGVIAVDGDERIISVNDSAVQMLGIRGEAKGRTVREVARNADLHELVSRTISSKEKSEAELTINGESERFLQAHGAVLRDARGSAIGAVIVLNDVTRMRKLEAIRRDFVGNVSHELRTPVTSIKGFVETLNDGALDNPEDARRFLGIISRQVDQLNALLEDLLLLSRIESGQTESPINFAVERLRPVLESAIEVSSLKAAAKDINIGLNCDKDLEVRINSPLLTQAIVNLIDNAVNYSKPGGAVIVEAETTDRGVRISVKDKGKGIEPEHIGRIFERFYRVDKARSRKMGGTGLGLAIVKHISQAHGGSVDVTSRPGSGSTFFIDLPL